MVIDTGPLQSGLLAVRDVFVNFYVLEGPRGLVCIDAGWRAHNGRRAFAGLGLDPESVEAVLLTHHHWDHVLGRGAFPRARLFHAPETGGEVRVAGMTLRVLAAPEHTKDSRAFLTEGGFLFTGDAVRLKRGLAAPPFHGIGVNAREGLRKLADTRGLAGIFTGHWGFTLEPDRALAAWRESPGTCR